jgi:hypothetical protein
MGSIPLPSERGDFLLLLIASNAMAMALGALDEESGHG